MHLNAFTNGNVGVIMILLQMCHIKAKGLTATAQGPQRKRGLYTHVSLNILKINQKVWEMCIDF